MSISAIDIKDEGLVAAMEALQSIKDMRPNNGKFSKLPFMQRQLYKEFHRVLSNYKNTGVIDIQDLKYFRYWVRYFGLSRDEFRSMVFTKSPNFNERELVL